MGAIIYYFSGTGNSLQVARDIANGLKNAKVVRITDDIPDEIVFEADIVGIVFPVYAYGLPLIVKRFIGKISIKNQGKYYFAVATCRSRAGGALLVAANMLKKRELYMNAGYIVYMPGNYIHLFDADTEEEQKAKFDVWDKQKKQIIEAVEQRKDNNYRRLTLKQRVLDSGILYPMAAKVFNQWDRQFSVDEKCKRCGMCVKICPVKNIKIIEGKLTWLHHCEQCLACINLCPANSIQTSKATPSRKRYIHPNVELEDLIYE